MNKIGIIGAMEIEVNSLKEDMTVSRTVRKAGMEFFEGELNGKQIVVVKSGIGKVNAAVCTQILVDEFCVDAVINTGIAGSLNADINIGDIVVSTDVVHHDVSAEIFGYGPGQIPQMDVFSFLADEEMAEAAVRVNADVNPDVQIFRGRVVSGDQFIEDQAKKQWLQSTFNGFCCEMEGAAIAQAAYLNNIPFLILRAISDKADQTAQMDYGEFERLAAAHCVKLTEELLKRL